MVLVAFLVALITLVLFGLTLPALIRRMHFETESPEDRHDAVTGLMRRVGEQAVDTLGPLEEQQVDGMPLDPSVVTLMKERILPRLVAGMTEKRRASPGTVEQTLVVQQRYVDAMRDALATERSIGAWSSQTFRQVEALLDSLERRASAG